MAQRRREPPTKNVKILQISAVGETVNAFLLPFLDRLAEQGYEVHVICSDGRHSEKLAHRGYTMKVIHIDRRIRPLSHLVSLARVYWYIRRQGFDLVHTYTPIASVIGRVAARLAGTQVVVHTSLGFYFHDNMPRWLRRSLILIERGMGGLTDFMFTVSLEDAETAIRERIMPPGAIRGLNALGVDVSHFSIGALCPAALERRRESLGIRPGTHVIVFVGRPVREKGVLDLVEAFSILAKKLADPRLIIVGDFAATERDTAAKRALAALISDRQVETGVTLTGYVPDIREYLAIADVFVLPSLREGMPQSVLEAMAMGKPVVATNIRGCREEVVDKVTGWLVPVRNPEALAEALFQILSSPETARRMGEAGRRRAVELFDERRVVQLELAVYQELLCTAHTRRGP